MRLISASKVPNNPNLLEQLQKELKARNGSSALLIGCKASVTNTPYLVAKTIISQTLDNPKMGEEIFGNKIIQLCKQIVK